MRHTICYRDLGLILPLLLICGVLETAGARTASYTVKGSVIDDTSNEGIPGLTVKFSPTDDGQEKLPVRQTETDMAGGFSLEYLYDVTYDITVSDTDDNVLYEETITITGNILLDPIRLKQRGRG